MRPDSRRTAPPAGWTAGFDDLIVVALGLTLLLAWDGSGFDLTAARWYGTPSGFAWRDHWLARGVLHEGGRALAWGVLALLVVNVWRPLLAGLSRSERWGWLAITLACIVLIPALKQLSATSCPYELAEFGGTARYVSHWRFGSVDGGSGHCFPSGHATGAFAFFGGYFVLRRHQPAAARAWLVAVCVTGALFGWAQMARGAHYPSHTLWSAWLCWTFWTLAWRAQAALPLR